MAKVKVSLVFLFLRSKRRQPLLPVLFLLLLVVVSLSLAAAAAATTTTTSACACAFAFSSEHPRMLLRTRTAFRLHAFSNHHRGRSILCKTVNHHHNNNNKKISNLAFSSPQQQLFPFPSSSSFTATATTTTALTMVIPSNQELVEQRLQASREKKEARRRSIQEGANRNYQLKRMLHTSTHNSTHSNTTTDATTGSTTNNTTESSSSSSSSSSLYPVPELYAVKVSVCPVLRQELKLNGREKRGRVFFEKKKYDCNDNNNNNNHHTIHDPCHSLQGLKRELHAFFRALRKSTYLLHASLPSMSDHNENHDNVFLLDSDEAVQQAFQAADDFYQDYKNKNHSNDDDTTPNDDSNTSNNQKTNKKNNNNDNNKTTRLQRPTLLLHVSKDPNAPAPPPPPTYLNNMPNPSDTDSMTMLSFYAFPPMGTITDPDDFSIILRRKWKPFHALGRVYVASEGINAQMSIPTNVLQQFIDCCRTDIPEIGAWIENGINVDPIPIPMSEFPTAGVPVNGRPAPPFRNLHIRVRNQVVADGLSKPLNWQSAGYDMPPLEWHATLKREAAAAAAAKREEEEKKKKKMNNENDTTIIDSDTLDSSSSSSSMIVLDCRNSYETDVGRFELAQPLETETFRDTWTVLEDKLKNTPKDTPIMMYCTGGIRCVKVGAYVTQELGFTNVNRLAGGIIAYDRELNNINNAMSSSNDKQDDDDVDDDDDDDDDGTTGNKRNSSMTKKEESLFKGTNFVFDGRLGRTITEDDFGICLTCGAETSRVSNCLNDSCHQRMVQCPTCQTNFHGTCSTACKQRVVNGGMVPLKKLQNDHDATESTIGNSVATTLPSPPMTQTFRTLEDYSSGHSSPAPSFYREMEYNTKQFLPTGAHMVSGNSQGRWLTQLASMTREGRILELGTFTGYATACFLEGAANAGIAASASTTTGQEVIAGGPHGGPYVLSLERDVRAIQIAAAHLRIMTEYGLSDEAAEAACALRSSTSNSDDERLPPVEFDENNFVINMTTPYKNIASCDIVRVTDALATVEAMAQGGGGAFVMGNTASVGKADAVSKPTIAPFDMVFVDADKTRLVEYVNALVSNDIVLKKGGLIVVDNVLWKGLVLEAQTGDFQPVKQDDDNENYDHVSDGDESDFSTSSDGSTSSTSEQQHDAGAARKGRRARKLATMMHKFNSEMAKDERVEVVVLPMRDGLSVIRKR